MASSKRQAPAERLVSPRSSALTKTAAQTQDSLHGRKGGQAMTASTPNALGLHRSRHERVTQNASMFEVKTVLSGVSEQQPLASQNRDSAQDRSSRVLLDVKLGDTSKSSFTGLNSGQNSRRHLTSSFTPQMQRESFGTEARNVGRAKQTTFLARVQQSALTVPPVYENDQSRDSGSPGTRPRQMATPSQAAVKRLRKKPAPEPKRKPPGGSLDVSVTSGSPGRRSAGRLSARKPISALPDKGAMRQEREAQEARRQRYQDFMHRLHVNFSRWIQKALNEEHYLHKAMEVHIRDIIRTREAAGLEAGSRRSSQR